MRVPFRLLSSRGERYFSPPVFSFSLPSYVCGKKSQDVSVSSLVLKVERPGSRVINRRREMLPNAIRCLHRQQLVECFRV